MEIRYYWEIAKKWIWLVAIGLILGVVGGYLLTQNQTPIYSASTKVMIQPPSNNSGTMTSTDYYFMYNQEQLVETYMQILSTQPTVDEISQKLGFVVYKGQITGRMISNTRVFEITVTHTDHVKAAQIANAAVEFLIAYNTTLQGEQFATSEDSLEAQITQVQEQISTAQQEIADKELAINSESSENISDELVEIQATTTELEDAIITQKTELVTLQTELARLETKNVFTDEIVGSPEEIAAVNEQIFTLQFDLDSNQNDLNYYRDKYYELLDSEVSPGYANYDDSYQLQQLKSNLALYQQMYTSLVANYENVRLERLRNTPLIVQLEKAEIPFSPISPSMTRNVGMGAAVGLVLVGGIIFLIEFLNDKIEFPEQIEAMCDLPVIGVISELPKQYRDGVMMNDRPRSPIVESFRILRNNIELGETTEDNHQTLLVISPNPSEGKSTVATNLAAAYAQQGRNTLLVDCDLRKPAVHRLYHLDNNKGFSSILMNGLTKQSFLDNSQQIGRNLKILTSGRISDECPDLITDQAPVIVPKFKQIADRVVFDSPPVLFSETFSLAKEVDGVIVIVKPGSTKLKSLKRLLEQMNWIGANVIGILFNQVNEKRHGYYYDHYYSSYNTYYGKKYNNYYTDGKEQAS